MKIVTVQFNYPGRPDYKKLLEVFKFSVKYHMPNVEFLEIKIPPPVNKTGRPLNYNYNDVKLKIWLDILEKSTDNIIFADCDMMAVKSAEHAFNIDFDVAYTQRTIVNRIPMNGGIIFAKPTEKAKAFFRRWYQVNNTMLHNKGFHREWSRRWAGMNQAAFGYLHEKEKNIAKLHQYKTRYWNAVDCDWNFINGNTVFIHYKSKLRRIVLSGRPGDGKYQKAAALWYEMEKRMRGPVKKKKIIHPKRRRRGRKTA